MKARLAFGPFLSMLIVGSHRSRGLQNHYRLPNLFNYVSISPVVNKVPLCSLPLDSSCYLFPLLQLFDRFRLS